MPKNAPGRNDPCPCGSGRKYKKCCLSRDEANGPKGFEPHGHMDHAGCAPQDHLLAGVLHVPEGLTDVEVREYVERMDRWTNAAHDALDEGRIEEAEHLADRLRVEYPDQVDGYQLRAQVRMKQTRWAEAAEGFDQAVAIALKHRADFDEEFIGNMHKDVKHARAHAEGHDWTTDSSDCSSHFHQNQS